MKAALARARKDPYAAIMAAPASDFPPDPKAKQELYVDWRELLNATNEAYVLRKAESFLERQSFVEEREDQGDRMELVQEDLLRVAPRIGEQKTPFCYVNKAGGKGVAEELSGREFMAFFPNFRRFWVVLDGEELLGRGAGVGFSNFRRFWVVLDGEVVVRGTWRGGRILFKKPGCRPVPKCCKSSWSKCLMKIVQRSRSCRRSCRVDRAE